MGCGSSVDVMTRIKEQEKKIDNLIEINHNLQNRINELSPHINEPKHASDTNDLTNLRSTIDVRFTKLEKTVEKIHNEVKNKLFEGIVDNLDDNLENRNRKESLTLNFEKENIGKTSMHFKRESNPHWNELLHDSNMTPLRITKDKLQTQEDDLSQRVINTKGGTKNYVDHHEIHMDFNN